MLIKYVGLTPVINSEGLWVKGDIKNADEALLKTAGFIPAYEVVKKKKIYKKTMVENLNDKFERDNKEIKEGETK